jgi:DNA mismatch repair ATPase MutS
MSAIWSKVKASNPDAVVFVRQGDKYLTFGEDVQTLLSSCKGCYEVLAGHLGNGMPFYKSFDCDLATHIPRLWSAGRRVIVVNGAAYDVSEDKALQRVKVTKGVSRIFHLRCVSKVKKMDNDYYYHFQSLFGSHIASTMFDEELVQFEEGWIVVKP